MKPQIKLIKSGQGYKAKVLAPKITWKQVHITHGELPAPEARKEAKEWIKEKWEGGK